MAIQLSEKEQRLFRLARGGDYNAFSTHYFRLPWSGTLYTPEDRVEQYEVLHTGWRTLGKPDREIKVTFGGNEILYRLMWGDYGSDPAFLYPHGYIFVPWALEMLTCGRMICVAEGGTGSSKTSSVGIAGLTKCAILPGFDFLNVAPTTHQATDMLEEVTKWVTGTAFEKFIVRTHTGELWKFKPFPTMKIDTGLGTFSTFSCMTIGVHGNFILGKGKDWINVDEAGLVNEIGAAIPPLITRIRGTRRNGRPRYSVPALSFITNPHDGNYSFSLLKEKARMDMEGEGDKTYYFVRPRTEDNVCITARQLRLQKAVMDESQQQRWLDGDDSVFRTLGAIPEVIIDECHRPYLDDLLADLRDKGGIYEERENLGIVRYELPYDPTRTYLVFGDPGTANLTSLSVNNVPFCGAFDITGFPLDSAVLVAYHLMDGDGKYKNWIDRMTSLMLKYKAIGAYDATGMGIGLSEWPSIRKFPLYQVSLAGNNKATAKTMFLLFAGDGLFAWPYVRAIWYQANAYRESGVGVKKIPDDVIAGLFVASFYLRYQFWNVLSEMYDWEKEREEKPEPKLDEFAEFHQKASRSRYFARYGGRYRR